MQRRAWVWMVAWGAACSPDSGRDDTTTTITTNNTMTAATTGATLTPTTGEAGSSGTDTGSIVGTSSGGMVDASSGDDAETGGPKLDVAMPDLPGRPLPNTELWYAVGDQLVYIEISALDGAVVQLVASTINNNPSLGGDLNSCGITMLEDGSLLGSRGNSVGTRMFHIADPPKVATSLDVDILGIIPGAIYVESLHTDCDGRVYLMDTGVDSVSNTGNRLLRFNGDYLGGTFSYDVITDLQVAVSADIDDMAPGIDAGGNVIDNPGYGIDSGMVYALDYTTGTGMLLGAAGTYGIHALGGPLFEDGRSRLYVLDVDANLYEADPVTLALSPSLATGPALMNGDPPGNTGIAGPLTNCVTGFPPG